MFGAQDVIVPPRYADDFKARLRDGQTAVVDPAGHMLPYERPEAIAGLINRFLREPAPAREQA